MGDAVDLYWIPLGAGGRVVPWCGRRYETLTARLARRRACDLYHAALELRLGGERFTVEMTPVPDGAGASRGAVGEGPVGTRWAGRLRVFRYEIRCWPGGEIPDVGYAVGGARRLSEEAACARRVRSLVGEVPRPTWGRDELRTGDMWTSNSVVAWVRTRGGIDAGAIAPPPGGRAPGWHAGVVAAGRWAR